MKTMKEIIDDLKTIIPQDSKLFAPMFRIENNKLYIGFLILEINENDKYFKRPTKWLLINAETEVVEKRYDSSTNDYATKPLSLTNTYENESYTKLFDDFNFIMTSYKNWKREMMLWLRRKENINNRKVLKIDGKILSTNEYLKQNISKVLNQVGDQMFISLGEPIEEAHIEYIYDMADKIRESYINKNEIDTDRIIQYNSLLKYIWPNQIDLINSFDNITNIDTIEEDNELEKLVKQKKEKKEEDRKQAERNKMFTDELIRKIDEKIAYLDQNKKNQDNEN